MLRVAVIGTSCSGKTTLARRIAGVKEIPHIELDAINWGANWTPLPLTEFRNAVSTEVARNEWVIDGNYRKLGDIIWP
jgi:adenylate kinase family enzyme